MKAFFQSPTPPSVAQLWLVTEEGDVPALILYHIASQGSIIIIKIGRIQHTNCFCYQASLCFSRLWPILLWYGLVFPNLCFSKLYISILYILSFVPLDCINFSFTCLCIPFLFALCLFVEILFVVFFSLASH